MVSGTRGVLVPARTLVFGIDQAWHLLGATPPGATREGLMPGQYRPVVGLTAGLLTPEEDLVTYTGSSLIQTDGLTLEGYRISFGQGVSLTIMSENVTLKNCLIEIDGRGLAGDTACIKGHSSYGGNLRGLKMYDCEIRSLVPSPRMGGIMGNDFTMQRCWVHNVVDAWHANTSGTPGVATQILGNVFSEGAHFTWDLATGAYISGPAGYDPANFPAYGSGHSDGQTHNDGIQWGYGTDTIVRGNDISGYQNAAIMLRRAGASGTLGPTVVAQNWLDVDTQASAASVNIYVDNGDTYSTWNIDNNIIGKRTAGGYEIIRSNAYTGTLSGNTHPEGTPVTITNGG